MWYNTQNWGQQRLAVSTMNNELQTMNIQLFPISMFCNTKISIKSVIQHLKILSAGFRTFAFLLFTFYFPYGRRQAVFTDARIEKNLYR